MPLTTVIHNIEAKVTKNEIIIGNCRFPLPQEAIEKYTSLHCEDLKDIFWDTLRDNNNDYERRVGDTIFGNNYFTIVIMEYPKCSNNPRGYCEASFSLYSRANKRSWGRFHRIEISRSKAWELKRLKTEKDKCNVNIPP
ncbi:MAG: hypothetical protein WCP18_03510 [bacterium]